MLAAQRRRRAAAAEVEAEAKAKKPEAKMIFPQPPYYPVPLAMRRAMQRMGAPPPQLNIDVTTDQLLIGNARAEEVSIGRRRGPAGELYNGVTVTSNLSDPLAQPDIAIGSIAVGVGGVGSSVFVEGKEFDVTCENDDGSLGDISLDGNVAIVGRLTVGGSSVPAPSYLEAWAPAGVTSVSNNAAVVFGNVGAGTFTVGTPTTSSFSIAAAVWGTYEVTWRVAVLSAAQFALYLNAGSNALGPPDGVVAPDSYIVRTQSGVSAAGVVVGQAIITILDGIPSPVVFSLRNTSGGSVNLLATGTPASIIIRRISQFS